MPGAGLTSGASAKALSDRPAFQPDWGKPAVRNDREDDGNIGIIRSPISAIVLPDHHSKPGPRHRPTRRRSPMSHGGLKRARSWKRRIQPKEAYSSPGLLYSETCAMA